MLAGLFFIKRDTKWFSLGGTVAGAASGFLIAYWSVVGYRWLDNTLTSYRNFDSTESAIVVIGVLVFAVIGNVADKKYSWHLTKKHKESIG
ncbi:hypothetical protein B0X71_13710 [Planococcus lenghuensis]|uniref:Uncharacterized protein n=1 Tax=Planococcus lenghuensis TaxID=2213202 RepID=A0A1Q2L2E3_9BACL|nr:hypothetical protein B0X71_13710 [Planococcus lenghuensis]